MKTLEEFEDRFADRMLGLYLQCLADASELIGLSDEQHAKLGKKFKRDAARLKSLRSEIHLFFAGEVPAQPKEKTDDKAQQRSNGHGSKPAAPARP